MKELNKLFVDWDLSEWANILEVVGFLFAIGTFIVGLFIKSEINQLKASYIFDRRAKKHIDNLEKSASEISQLLNDYDNNIHNIKTEFSKCISELEDIIPKIGYRQSLKCRRLKTFLKRRRIRPFVIKQAQTSSFIFFITKYPKRLYQTSYDDTWYVYDRLNEVIRQLENIKQNKDKSL